jgi:hypothetical protein
VKAIAASRRVGWLLGAKILFGLNAGILIWNHFELNFELQLNLDSPKSPSTTMPDYGSKSYWDTRYQTVETPFDWMVDYAAISRTLEPLLPDKDASILIVGCGDAPFSADLYYIGGYLNQLNVDYSEVVIEKQRKLWPEICWNVMDCLDMKDIAENSLGKSTISSYFWAVPPTATMLTQRHWHFRCGH